MDAFLADVTRLAPIQRRTTARESFTASMRLLGKAYPGRLGKILEPLLGRAQADESLREAVRTRWGEPRRQVAREIVRRAIQSGELRRDLDPDVVLDALYGPFYHRLLVPYKNGVISDAFIDTLVDTVVCPMLRSSASGMDHLVKQLLTAMLQTVSESLPVEELRWVYPRNSSRLFLPRLRHTWHRFRRAPSKVHNR